MDQPGDENKSPTSAALQPTPSDRLIGQVIGEKYVLERLVGTGAKGRVYVASQTALGHSVAIKVLLEEAEDEHEERFRQEAQALLKLRHASIVCVRDFGYHEFRPYIVMDLVDGLSLEKLLKENGRLSDAEARSIFAQAAAGLEHAHEQGILHRDIKPANIMLRLDGGDYHVSLVDFGLAKSYSLDGKSISGLTATGSLIGTPQYMSPEQCTGTDLDPRSDIYALGCVMYEAVTGRQCFSATGLFDCLYKQINEMPPSFHDLKGDAPVRSTLEDVIMKCLSKNRDHRYSSAAALAAALSATTDVSLTASTITGLSRWKRIASQRIAKQKGTRPSIPTITLTPIKTFDRAMAAFMDASLVASIGAFWLILIHLLAQTFLKDTLRDPFPSIQLLIPLLIGDWFAGGLLLIPLMLYWSSLMPLDPTNQSHLWFGLVMVVGLYGYGAGTWLYRAGLESWHTQATLGKMMLGLVVTDNDGIRLTFGEALWRSISRVFTIAFFIDGGRFLYAVSKGQNPRAVFRHIVLVPAHDWLARSQVRQQDDSTAKLDFRYPVGVAMASVMFACWGNGHYFVAWLLGWLLTAMSGILWIGYVHRLCMLLQAQPGEVRGVNPWVATGFNAVGMTLMAAVQVFTILVSSANVVAQLPASFYGALGKTPNAVVGDILQFIAKNNLLGLSRESIFGILAASTVTILAVYLWLFLRLEKPLAAATAPRLFPIGIAVSLAGFPLIWFTGLASTRCIGCGVAFIFAFILLGRLSRRFSVFGR